MESFWKRFIHIFAIGLSLFVIFTALYLYFNKFSPGAVRAQEEILAAQPAFQDGQTPLSELEGGNIISNPEDNGSSLSPVIAAQPAFQDGQTPLEELTPSVEAPVVVEAPPPPVPVLDNQTALGPAIPAFQDGQTPLGELISDEPQVVTVPAPEPRVIVQEPHPIIVSAPQPRVIKQPAPEVIVQPAPLIVHPTPQPIFVQPPQRVIQPIISPREAISFDQNIIQEVDVNVDPVIPIQRITREAPVVVREPDFHHPVVVVPDRREHPVVVVPDRRDPPVVVVPRERDPVFVIPPREDPIQCPFGTSPNLRSGTVFCIEPAARVVPQAPSVPFTPPSVIATGGSSSVVVNSPDVVKQVRVVEPVTRVVEQPVTQVVEAPRVIKTGVPATEFREVLPKTGLPLAGWSLLGLLPAGIGFTKIYRDRKANEGKAEYIWQERQFGKSTDHNIEKPSTLFDILNKVR